MEQYTENQQMKQIDDVEQTNDRLEEKYRLLDFLKKYSDVDIDFIKEFVTIQEQDHVHVPFTIDLEIVAKWLKTKKGILKDTLISSYTENVDYILLHVNQKQVKHGGNNKELILLAPDTFKMLCMKSHTKDADKIRYYYVSLEKLVYIFKDDIIKNQKERIDELEANMHKIKYPVKGAIYVIAIDPKEEGYRIGKTTDMNKRYKLYKSAHKNNPKVKFVFYSDDIDQLENCIKNLLRYDQYRDRKEFYIVELKEIISSIEDCNILITKFRCKMCKTNDKINELNRHINSNHTNDEIIRFHLIKKYE